MKSAVFSYAHLGVDPTFDPHRKFVSSPVLSPALLAAARTLLALYAICTICTVLAFNVAMGDGNSFLSYFTQLSYIGLTAYYCAAAVQTAFYARYGTYPLQRWPRPLQALHVLLQSTVVSFRASRPYYSLSTWTNEQAAAFIVTVVFWALLSSPETFGTRYNVWSAISVHALNSAYALFELLLTNAPPAPWLALPLHVLLLAAYLGVAYVTYAAQGFYTYPFLNPHTQHALLAAYIAGIALGAVVVFLVGRGVAGVRTRIAGRFAASSFKVGGGGGKREGGKEAERDENEKRRGGGGGGEAMDEWEEVARPTGTDAV
ncbi:hypothetical protein B0H11DRAFT_1345230 [Mycena galericulata]|nr:hypothetical protein B0H11DRAFT_1345230 [Mycena galericulata]